MNNQELLTALKRLKVQTGSLACLGCGYEHNCSTKGCAILREAIAEMEKRPPMVHAHWVADGYGTFYCSECGRGTNYRTHGLFSQDGSHLLGTEMVPYRTPRCHWCGAIMDEEVTGKQ